MWGEEALLSRGATVGAMRAHCTCRTDVQPLASGRESPVRPGPIAGPCMHSLWPAPRIVCGKADAWHVVRQHGGDGVVVVVVCVWVGGGAVTAIVTPTHGHSAPHPQCMDFTHRMREAALPLHDLTRDDEL